MPQKKRVCDSEGNLQEKKAHREHEAALLDPKQFVFVVDDKTGEALCWRFSVSDCRDVAGLFERNTQSQQLCVRSRKVTAWINYRLNHGNFRDCSEATREATQDEEEWERDQRHYTTQSWLFEEASPLGKLGWLIENICLRRSYAGDDIKSHPRLTFTLV